MNRKSNKRTRSVTLAALTVILSAGAHGAARSQNSNLVVRAKPFERVSNLLERQVEALGRRGRDGGREQSVYTGEFVDAITGQRAQVRVVYQLPGLVRLEGFAPDSRVVSFDGVRNLGVATRTDELLLEMFTTDTVEGMLSSLQGTAALRFLGARFGADPRAMPNYGGPRYDLYEVALPVPSRPDRLIRLKLFYFDSDTGLLHKTRYRDRSVTPSLEVETRFSNWRMFDGSASPGLIERFEDGRPVFSLRMESFAAGPRIGAEKFR